eukprot:TRINITY_DN810_c0_g1_i3.p1 TRINITY_DN810_c0_g1~~TRINITY_DN810_c0_g1_i3.p1  ORF type:complete len:1343 (-),score=212.83 TRINITY_DN810_c0_g1_i3:4-4032(-)
MLTENYLKDMKKSLYTPLFIEINRKDMALFLPGYELNLTKNLPLTLAAEVYNNKLKDNQSNLLYIEPTSSTSCFVILETILQLLEEQLKDIKSIEALKKSLQGVISITTGGWVDSLVGDYLDKGLEAIFSELSDYVNDTIIDAAKDNIDISGKLTNFLQDSLVDTTGNKLAAKAELIKTADIYLCDEAKAKLDKLSTKFNKSSRADVFQLAFKLLMILSHSSPRLLWINNPQYLDINSLELISLVLAQNKYQKELGKRTGISIVFQYSDEQFQPYSQFPTEFENKQTLLNNQRSFAQRYGMLERPTHDMPKVAVKAASFVGREVELQDLVTYFENRKQGSISIVSGEPGIGKTTLINHHIRRLQKHERNINLTLINEAGNTSTNTGLSALEQSIIEEAHRLDALKGLSNKGKDFFKSQVNIENAVKAIGAIFGVSVSGVDKLASTIDKVTGRIGVSNSLAHMKKQGQQALNRQNSETKTQQFEKINKAIDVLKSLVGNKQPVTIFIDDIQWIDDVAAEYLLKHMLNKNIYIVTSVRPSDAATLFANRINSQDRAFYQHVNYLFSKLGIAGLESADLNIEADRVELQAIKVVPHTLYLNGLDQLMLQTILGRILYSSDSQLVQLSRGIISALKGEGAALKGAERVNTLFAIETINMLCDSNFYNDKATLPLILQRTLIANNEKPYEINPEIVNFSSVLDETFKQLIEKYQISLSHYNSADLHSGFSLMAYAVMEERLNLIKIYFGQFGDCAVYSLLFSSLLGAPFSSKVVRDVIEGIIFSNDELLAPIQALLPSECDYMSLTAEHYTIMDEIYEVLRRLPNYAEQYNYKHGLLATFFKQQLSFIITTIEGNDKKNENSLNWRLLQLIYKVIDVELGGDKYINEGVAGYFKELPLRILKRDIAEFFYSMDGTQTFMAAAYCDEALIVLRLLINLNENQKAMEELLCLEQKISTEPYLQIIFTMEEQREALSVSRAHIYSRQKDPHLNEKSVAAFEELNLLSSKYKKNSPDNFRVYAREMSGITAKLDNKKISIEQAHYEYLNVFEEFDNGFKDDSFGVRDLIVSLVLNIALTSSSPDEKEQLLLKACQFATENYTAYGEQALDKLIETKSKFVTFLLNTENTHVNAIEEAVSSCIDIYKMMSEYRKRLPGCFDEYYFPCVFRLLSFKQYSDREFPQLPSEKEITQAFLDLKENKPAVYESNLDRFKSFKAVANVGHHLKENHEYFYYNKSNLDLLSLGNIVLTYSLTLKLEKVIEHIDWLIKRYDSTQRSELALLTLSAYHRISQESIRKDNTLNETLNRALKRLIDTDFDLHPYLLEMDDLFEGVILKYIVDNQDGGGTRTLR